MSYRTYRLFKAIVVVIVAILVGWAVPAGNAIVPVPAAITGMLVLFWLRRGVKDIVVDERIHDIANRAARAAFQIVTLVMVLIGATLIALGNGKQIEAETAGFTLIYSACGLLVVYLTGYAYYSRKFGSKV